jgi:hypothetical protein
MSQLQILGRTYAVLDASQAPVPMGVVVFHFAHTEFHLLSGVSTRSETATPIIMPRSRARGEDAARRLEMALR